MKAQWTDFITLLKREVVPALGCTEPMSVALAAANCRKLPSGLIALAVFVAFALMGALFGFGRSGNSGGAIGAEICRATCTARGWRDGSLVPPERAATGTSHGPKTCQCR